MYSSILVSSLINTLERIVHAILNLRKLGVKEDESLLSEDVVWGETTSPWYFGGMGVNADRDWRSSPSVPT
jgi:hypothetical protein